VQHGQHTDEHQHRDDQPEGLPTAAAVEMAERSPGWMGMDLNVMTKNSAMPRTKRAKARTAGRLRAAYSRIRQNVRNGLAVVTVKRDACGGCFNRIPPQRQVDIRQGKKIIICEYCGRILVADPDETQE